MNDESWTKRWNERYANELFAYGKEPNDYLKQQLDNVPPGKILFPAEGEGRNAVYAALLGWEVSAFDISAEGKKKAVLFAESNGVAIDYQVGDIREFNYYPGQFDAIALIYAHFPADIKSTYHRILDQYLRPGGLMIFEAFSKRHIEYLVKNKNVGGPGEIGMLFSMEELESDFANYEVLELEEREIELDEGPFHQGTGSVIRFTGRKK